MGNQISLFNSRADNAKLKSSLNQAAKRLKMLQKKKTEMAIKERVEIASYLKDGKFDNARTKVQNVIINDFTVEAYEILEHYCNLLTSRFSLIQKIRQLDPSIAQAVSSICWSIPRVSHEIPELKVVFKGIEQRYGREYVEKALVNDFNGFVPDRVNEKLIQKVSGKPSKALIEKYLIEIAKHYAINFIPNIVPSAPPKHLIG